MTTSNATTIAIIGAGSVGRALGRGLSAQTGVDVVYGVRDPADPRHGDLGPTDTPPEAVEAADVVILAVPAGAVAEVIPGLGLRTDQIVVDATNALDPSLRGPHPTMGELVASLLPDGLSLAKAFNTIGAEFLADGRVGADRAFLPVAGDEAAVAAVLPLASGLGFEAVAVGDRSSFAMLEEHARLWIHLAFRSGFGRDFAFVVRRPN